MGLENSSPSTAGTLASKTVKGHTVDTHNQRLRKYETAHYRVKSMSEYIRKNFKGNKTYLHLARQIEECGAWLLFRHYYQVDEIRLHMANFCKKHILCPLCAIRRGGKAVEAYMNKLEVILQEHEHLKLYLVTFTIKNREDLGDAYNHLHQAMKTMLQQRRNALKGTRPSIQMNKAEGGVTSYEFKIGENSGLWHPHAHSLWLCSSRPDQQQLSEEWKAITGDSFIVDVRPINPDDMVSGFLEVFKYAVKFTELPKDKNLDAFLLLKGRRLINPFGLFHGTKIPDTLTDDPIKDEPYIELFYRFMEGQGYVLDPKGFNPKIDGPQYNRVDCAT